ncbi:MAG: TetR/AcrR family transcriptional regulator [Solirubrobacterales bacterium]|nr:TetR/AcrR family transcriptional regulator [Solirubrobacterales bacterium]
MLVTYPTGGGGARAGADRAQRGRAAGGRPRDPSLEGRILAAAEQRLREHGYAGMSIEAVASAAGTSVPSVRRRYRDRPALAAAVIDAWRVEPLPQAGGPARQRALAILENFRRNLSLGDSMPLLGTLLAEEGRHPELIERFRARLVKPRRAMLAAAIAEGVAAGALSPDTEVDALANMLIGSFYARHVARGVIPRDWARRVLAQAWPVAKQDR